MSGRHTQPVMRLDCGLSKACAVPEEAGAPATESCPRHDRKADTVLARGITHQDAEEPTEDGS